MSRFPRIDTPCPLSAEARNAIDGHCAHCDRHVHRLDDLSEAARRALLADAGGSICVSYRRPAARHAGRVGTAIAATLIVAGGLAQAGVPVADAPSPTAPSVGTQANDPAASPSVREALSAIEAEPMLQIPDDVLVMGGVSAPGEADWSDDDDALPPLPMHDVVVSGRGDGD